MGGQISETAPFLYRACGSVCLLPAPRLCQAALESHPCLLWAYLMKSNNFTTLPEWSGRIPSSVRHLSLSTGPTVPFLPSSYDRITPLLLPMWAQGLSHRTSCTDLLSTKTAVRERSSHFITVDSQVPQPRESTPLCVSTLHRSMHTSLHTQTHTCIEAINIFRTKVPPA